MMWGRPLQVVTLGLAIACSSRVEAQLSSPARADSSVRYLLSHLALRDTTCLVPLFDPQSFAAQGISRDSLLKILLAGFDIGPVQKAVVIDRAEFHPLNATRIEEELAYHVIGQRDTRLVFVAATTDSGRTRLTGVRWQRAPTDLRQMNPFRFAGMSWLHYGMLAF